MSELFETNENEMSYEEISVEFDPEYAIKPEDLGAVPISDDELDDISGGASKPPRFTRGSAVYYYKNGYYYPGVVQAVILESPYYKYIVAGIYNGRRWQEKTYANQLMDR